MQPIKIVLEGLYWDVQLYSGRLYLFERAGAVITVNWDSLVGSLSSEVSDLLPIECAFRRGDYLYADDLGLFFQDIEIKSAITSKFERLATQNFHISREQIDRHKVGEQDNPFPFPHADCTIYSNHFWVVGMDGLFSGSCARRTKYPLSTKVLRKWDAPVFATSASYGSLALAAGSEGLWEHSVNIEFYLEHPREPYLISQSECDSCDWMYHNIYGKSYEGGFLAEFEKVSTDYHEARRFRDTISSNEIFNKSGYSWGSRDKIYLTSPGNLDVVKYSPFHDETLIRMGSYRIAEWKGGIVSGGVAAFGAIAEYANAIVVLPSQGEPVTLLGEPVRWRVYPRSNYYQNHLHVVYEDRLEILSFNQDYFVDQSSKVFGSSPIFSKRRTYRSS